MIQTLLLSLLFIFLTSCFDKTQSPHTDATIAKPIKTTTPQTHIQADSTVTLFGNSSYQLALHIFDTANKYEAERNNTVLTFSRINGNQRQIFFRDSLFCMYPDIDFEDFNNDKVKDILVFYYTGARSNPTYHLYLSDIKNHNLIRIKGF